MLLLSTGPQHPGGCVRCAQNKLQRWEHAPQSQPHQPCCKPKSSPSSTGQRCSVRAPKRPGFGIPEANRPPTRFRSFSEVPRLPQLAAVQKRACSEGLSTQSCWLGKEMLSGAPGCGGVSKRGIGMGIGIILVLPSLSTFLPLETHSTNSDRAQRAEVAEEAPSEHILGGIPPSWWAQGTGQRAGRQRLQTELGRAGGEDTAQEVPAALVSKAARRWHGSGGGGSEKRWCFHEDAVT